MLESSYTGNKIINGNSHTMLSAAQIGFIGLLYVALPRAEY